MSKIILDGYRIDPSHDDISAFLLKNMVWYDKPRSEIKVGNKRLNYYLENDVKVLTTFTQDEMPGRVILPVEFTVLSSN